MKIPKATLKALNGNVGKIDLDSGHVFDGFVGAINPGDMLYHGELTFSAAVEGAPKAGEFSISAVLGSGQKAASESTTKPTAEKPAATKKVKDDGRSKD